MPHCPYPCLRLAQKVRNFTKGRVGVLHKTQHRGAVIALPRRRMLFGVAAAAGVAAFPALPRRATPTRADTSVHISILGPWGGQAGFPQDLLRAFAVRHPRIRVSVFTPLSQDAPTTFAQQVRAGVADVIPMSYGLTAMTFIRKGWLLDLRPFVTAANFNPNPFGALMKQLASPNGLYMLPYTVLIKAVLCNQELFAAANVPLPGLTWTWPEFLKTARRLTRTAGGARVWGLAANSSDLVWQWMQQVGRGGTAAPSPETLRRILGQFGGRAGSSFLLPTATPSVGTGVFKPLNMEGSTSQVQRWSAFANARAAMMVTGADAWLLSRVARLLPVRWAVVPTPHPAGAPNEIVLSGVSVLGAAAATRAPEAAWTFIAFASGPDGVVAFEPGSLPAYRSPQTESRWVAAARPAPGMEWVFHMPWAVAQIPGGVLISGSLFNGINGVLYHGWSVDKAVALYETAAQQAGVHLS